MQRSEKEKVVADLAERLRAAQALIVADYRGLSMTEIDRLRTDLLSSGARFSVVKNTLTQRAAEEAGMDAIRDLLDGPTAIAFVEAGGDPVAVAKVLNEAARTTRILVVKGGILEGATISEEDVRNLATLPPADVLRGQVVGAITGPLMILVGLLNAPLRDLVGVVEARVRQLEESGGEREAALSPEGDSAHSPEAEPVAVSEPTTEEE